MKKILAVIAGMVFAMALIALFYDAPAKVTITEQTAPALLVATKPFIGNYKKSGAVMDEVYTTLDASGIKTTKGIGIYFDSPQKVGAANCRAAVGCIIAQIDSAKAATRFTVTAIPASKAFGAQHSYKGNFSIMVGTLKVYPKLAPHLQGPSVEIYDSPARKIFYWAYQDIDSTFWNQFLK